jgi:WD40 repeat protein
MARQSVPGDQAGADVVYVGRPPPDDETRRAWRIAALLSLAVLLLASIVVVALVQADHRQTAGPGGLDPTSPTTPGGTTTGAPEPIAPVANLHADGALFGSGAGIVGHHQRLHVPRLASASSPTWSPDGRQLAVLDHDCIVVTHVDTGASHRIACPSCREISWSPDGRVFAAAPVENGSLGLVDATTSELTTIPVPQEDAVLSLTWAPGSDELAFLANAGGGHSGVYTIRADGTGLTQVVGLATHFPHGGSAATTAILVRWSPTGQSLAVLTATPDPPSGPPPISLYRLRVVTMNPDGTALKALVDDGRCVCTGFTPNLAWSPDGTTLALSTLLHHRSVTRRDGEGRAVHIRFLTGASGPLAWQPLPAPS